MKRPKAFRVTLVPVGAVTHLMCIVCGNFRTELAVVAGDGLDPQVGMHHRCLRELNRARQTRKRGAATQPSPPPPGCEGDDVDAGCNPIRSTPDD